MESILRPATKLASSARPILQMRGHKTTARTKRSLKIAPHDSFLPDRSASFPAADSIIYNPPSSEATPAHTPFIFLPRTDPRKSAIHRMRSSASASFSSSSSSSATSTNPFASPSSRSLPPAMKYKGGRSESKYHLSAEDVQEMRKLREQDPLKWSVNQLARKFECSPIFVKIAAPASKEHTAWIKEKKDRQVARWGPKKTQAREERKIRSDMVYRGEL